MKIKDSEDKIADHSACITFNDFDRFSSAIFDERLTQAKLATNKDLDTAEVCVIENKKRMGKLQTFHFSYFLGKLFWGDDGF